MALITYKKVCNIDERSAMNSECIVRNNHTVVLVILNKFIDLLKYVPLLPLANQKIYSFTKPLMKLLLPMVK